MSKLYAAFDKNPHFSIALDVPPLALHALQYFANLLDCQNICIGGGFMRGLYMTQYLGLEPQMNDIDLFADISLVQFDKNEQALISAFGEPVRFHHGQFEKEDHQRGLIEFTLPRAAKSACAGVESLQLNFGQDHPWANPHDYVTHANIGINQIALDLEGRVWVSNMFLKDMELKTMTMNGNREWSAYDWARTVKAMNRMQAERPEFRGWMSVTLPKPDVQLTGTFWQNQSLDTRHPV